MTQVLQSFATHYFEDILLALDMASREELLNNLSLVVFSHRHNKEGASSLDALDFTLVRDTMYKYSKKSQDRFLAQPILAYLYIWFAQSPEAMEFVQNKFADKGREYFKKMKAEIDELQREAFEYLS